ncbi:hypothetical protein Lesp02_36860 [Lentzea sp. NBRC 105346]|uniref:hypothetical protein n=1 Tax=Lentzea sp. NBRC 105346 TaxID=3032205 RepID=UPI0024A1FC68|nr:hypothetical protein [Lentzea sp. NBRC 105346]GLZ31498.1 hypothetical protein Lesp02_36860 [Lentzea sp. NBRC 105346]
MINNSALVGPGAETRQRLGALLAAAPSASVYRIGRGADPLPVAASFDPSDQPGSRSLLDWFERLVLDPEPRSAVLVVDDWALCHDLDPGIDRAVQWVAALGPRRGVQVVVTARTLAEIPPFVRRLLS